MYTISFHSKVANATGNAQYWWYDTLWRLYYNKIYSHKVYLEVLQLTDPLTNIHFQTHLLISRSIDENNKSLILST